MPAKPPDLCGFTALASPRVDQRWLFARRNAAIDLRYTDNIVINADRWVNAEIAFQPDAVDEWSLPQVTLARGYGDCEDIALLKWAICIRSGMPESSLYFVLAKDLIALQDHAVLLAKDCDTWRLLDSHNSLSLPVDQVRDYMPIEAFSGEQAWIYGRKMPVAA